MPGRRGWRATPKAHPARHDHNPALVPTSPLKPHLIETVVILPGARRPAEERVPAAETVPFELEELRGAPSPVEARRATEQVKPQAAPFPVELVKPRGKVRPDEPPHSVEGGSLRAVARNGYARVSSR